MCACLRACLRPNAPLDAALISSLKQLYINKNRIKIKEKGKKKENEK